MLKILLIYYIIGVVFHIILILADNKTTAKAVLMCKMMNKSVTLHFLKMIFIYSFNWLPMLIKTYIEGKRARKYMQEHGEEVKEEFESLKNEIFELLKKKLEAVGKSMNSDSEHQVELSKEESERMIEISKRLKELETITKYL